MNSETKDVAKTIACVVGLFAFVCFALWFIVGGVCVEVRQPYFLLPIAIAWVLSRTLKRRAVNDKQLIIFRAIEVCTLTILVLTLIGLLLPTYIFQGHETVNGVSMKAFVPTYGIPKGYNIGLEQSTSISLVE